MVIGKSFIRLVLQGCEDLQDLYDSLPGLA